MIGVGEVGMLQQSPKEQFIDDDNDVDDHQRD
jgi:hypothetical protein